MAGRARYPLEAARTLRTDEESAAKNALATRLREQQEAETALGLAQGRLTAHRGETARVAELERAADGIGRSVGETLRVSEWLKRRRAEVHVLAKRAADAAGACASASAESERARAALADARAAREAIEKHHASWLAGELRADEARAEAEVEDVMAGRRPR